MLRLSEFIRKALGEDRYRPFPGVILIWNLTNRCNLYCKHCYSSANQETKGELSLTDIERVAGELVEENVRFAILSGGEPLLRGDIYDIAEVLKGKGIKTYLSTNGLLINQDNVYRIRDSFDYVGISIDGTPEIHDSFRGKRHSFEEALNALRLCQRIGIKAGLRFTLTEQTAGSLPFIFELVEEIGVPKVYISHLVYSGRGQKLKDVDKKRYRELVEYIVSKAFEFVEEGKEVDIVTGNNEADAVVLLKEFEKRYPDKKEKLLEILRSWGGNQAGVRLVNIDYRGNVKPDPFFFHSLGSLRERSFSEIWNSNGLLSKLREKPRTIKGRCSNCPYLDICNGNSRARAYFSYGDYFAEDPACYI
ncbi:radical SAM protein with 4Fe4S-binding SPASM domain [Hydrogenivirga caldilitoris]|uniref:Radical SAM protein with 4Fe4S-binding SPASM domain n=1 Tax=Hydrogenivirga caldilitoris TaxID=246264 RepID=A0A497XRQ6_9AQUI|nr:radical SAM protein [Hydrogenivirga caldilitoris]RLJ70840.1 radical SAM protein with 4Fe4S-binding SPASM domain [Hydrogenivirga caldilitoris]